MITSKTTKELAFVHELFVATDWGERFAELIDNHVKLPKRGRVLYVGSNTGGHALALMQRGPANLTFVCVDENKESLELARIKAKTSGKGDHEFRAETVDRLSFKDDEFALVIGDGSLVHSERIPEMLAELVRVAAPGAGVVLALPSYSSFGEFFSIYWEALHNRGLIDHESDVEALISVLPAVFELEKIGERAGLEEIASTTTIEEFDYESADKFLQAPLIADFLLPIWLETLPEEAREGVVAELGRLINEESRDGGFALTMKATVVTGKKQRSH
jgi:ubiquinone/menaquinone biosynthesis C-methylase UbiE